MAGPLLPLRFTEPWGKYGVRLAAMVVEEVHSRPMRQLPAVGFHAIERRPMSGGEDRSSNQHLDATSESRGASRGLAAVEPFLDRPDIGSRFSL